MVSDNEIQLMSKAVSEYLAMNGVRHRKEDSMLPKKTSQ